LFDQFFVDNNNRAPACPSHHSVWFDLSHIDNDCAHDLIYHVTYSFDHHPSRCVCKQSVQYRDPNNCLQFHSYQELMKLYDTNLCSSKNSQWNLLNDLEIRSPDCRKKIIAELAQHFHKYPSVGACHCFPVKNISNDEPVLNDDKRDQCSNVQYSSYSHLRQELFQGASVAGCASHAQLWQQLQDIQQSHGYDCTMDMILRTANKYPSVDLDPCRCTGSLPPTTRATTAASHSPNKFLCQKIGLVLDITANIHLHATGSTPCESKISGTNEDLVLTLCNMTSLDTWSRGQHVISNCDRIPSYSPIASFSPTGRYMPLDAQSGVFLGCISEGFKMAIQPCYGAPQIIHVETTGVFNNNATIYYTVV
ncbi:hypothetical protein DPMN_188576, partial [Dreissena polymorpha]